MNRHDFDLLLTILVIWALTVIVLAIYVISI